VDLLCSVGDFSNFCKLISASGLDVFFSPIANNPLTVFVPQNEAFEALEGNLDHDYDSLTTEESAHLLLSHVIFNECRPFAYGDLECGETTERANGDIVRTKCTKEGDKFQKGPKQMDDMLAKIVLHNIDVCNGKVLVVDNVILPNFDKMAWHDIIRNNRQSANMLRAKRKEDREGSSTHHESL
jgi:uncharacterized surface protein with fasciclin (FAS1) repeats